MRFVLLPLVLVVALTGCALSPDEQDKRWCDQRGIHENGDSQQYIICRAQAAMARQHSGGFGNDYHPADHLSQDEVDERTCINMGAPPSDPKYFQCRSWLDARRNRAEDQQQRADDEQQQNNAAALRAAGELFKAGTPTPPPPVQLAPTYQTTCQQVGAQISCTTR